VIAKLRIASHRLTYEEPEHFNFIAPLEYISEQLYMLH